MTFEGTWGAYLLLTVEWFDRKVAGSCGFLSFRVDQESPMPSQVRRGGRGGKAAVFS